MQTPKEIRQDLPPDLDAAEREALVGTGMRLQVQRPAPNPNFRGELRRRLSGDASSQGERSAVRLGTVRALSASYACFGVVLLGIAAAGLTGAGPFAA